MARDRSVFQQAIENLARIPRDAWLVGLLACGVSASSDIALWLNGEEPNWTWVAPILVLAAVWLAAVYICAVGIARRSASLWGYSRFALTSVATVAPLILTLGLLVFAKPYLSEDARLWLLLTGVVIGFLFASLLAGWPMTQSTSSVFVSPLRVFRATRGHRGSLIFLGFAAGGIGRADMVPDISSANNFGEAVLIALADGLVGLLVLGLTAAIASAAWQFIIHADPSLDEG